MLVKVATDGSKPLSKTILTFYQWGPMVISKERHEPRIMNIMLEYKNDIY